MTPNEYRAAIRDLGLTPCKSSYNGSTLHETRDRLYQQVPDPETLLPNERADAIALIKWRLTFLE